MKFSKRLRLRLLLTTVIIVSVSIFFTATTQFALAKAWKPKNDITIIVGSGPGSSNDRMGRLVQNILMKNKLIKVSVAVVTKKGGGGAIAWNYMNRFKGNGHYLAVMSPNILTNQITGINPLKYTDVTPIALLLEEYVSFSVKKDSPLAKGGDFVGRLKKNPGALSLGIATSLAGPNHLAVSLVLKRAGVKISALRTVVFNSGGKALTAMLGGHIDLVPGPVANVVKHLEAGTARSLGVTAPKRMPGIFASVPTWKEQGINATFGTGRGLLAPGGLSEEQIAFWDKTLSKVVATPLWKKTLARHHQAQKYLNSKGVNKYLGKLNGELTAIISELGLIRK